MDGKDLITKDARQNQKHFINTKLVDLITYRQSRKWYVSISVVAIFSFILASAIIALVIWFFVLKKTIVSTVTENVPSAFKLNQQYFKN